MQAESLLKDIEIVSSSINYWFVRTESGDNYETFQVLAVSPSGLSYCQGHGHLIK
jgi:hypothetical protein